MIAAVSQIGPREVLTRIEVGFISPISRAPAAMTHKGVIFGDASRRAEDEAPSELGRILVTAAPLRSSWAAGAAHRDAAVAERCHVERSVAHAGRDQQFQLRQALDDAS